MGDELDVRVKATTAPFEQTLRGAGGTVRDFAALTERASASLGAAFQRWGALSESASTQSRAAIQAWGASVQANAERAIAAQQRATDATRGVANVWTGVAQAAAARQAEATRQVSNAWAGIGQAARQAQIEQHWYRAGQAAGQVARTITGAAQSIGSALKFAAGGVVVLNQGLDLAARLWHGVESVVDRTVGATARQGDAYLDLAHRLQFSVEQVSRWDFAARQANTSVEEVGLAFRGMSRAIAEGATSGTESNRIFTEGLGFTARQLRELQTLSPEQALFRIAAAFEATGDSAQKTADMQAVFGRGYQAVLALLAEGPEAFRRNIEEADRLGLTWTQKTAESGDRLGDTVGLLSGALEGLRKRIFGTTDTLDPLSTAIAAGADKLVQFGKDIPESTLAQFRATLALAATAGVDVLTRAVSYLIDKLPAMTSGLAAAAARAGELLERIRNVVSSGGLSAFAGGVTGAVAGGVLAGPAGVIPGAKGGAALGAVVGGVAGYNAPTESEADQAAREARIKELQDRIRRRGAGLGARLAPGDRTDADEKAELERLYADRVPKDYLTGGRTDAPPTATETPAPPSIPSTAAPGAGGGGAPYGRSTEAADKAARDAEAAAAKAARERYEGLQRDQQLELDAVRSNAEKRLAIVQGYTIRVRELYGDGSKEYERQLHLQNQAEADAAGERASIREIEINARRDHALRELEREHELDQARLDRDEITKAEFLRRLEQYYADRRDIQQRAIDERGTLVGDDPREQASLAAESEQVEDEFQGGRQEVDVLAQQETLAARVEVLWSGVWGALRQTATASINAMIAGTFRLSQAVRSMGATILGSIVQTLLQWVAEWAAAAAKRLAIAAAEKLGLVAAAKATAAGTAKAVVAEGYATLYSQAVAAAAKAAAAAAGNDPYGISATTVFNSVLDGMIAGGSVYLGIASGFAGGSAASAAGGFGDVPADDTLTFLHRREMVLPRDLAEGIRARLLAPERPRFTLDIPGGGRGFDLSPAAVRDAREALLGDTPAGGGRVEQHLHLHAMDHHDVRRWAERPENRATLGRVMERYAKDRHMPVGRR